MAAADTTIVTEAPNARKMSPLKALGLLVLAMAMVAGYLALFGAIGNQEFYAGFVFLLCWTLIEQGKMARLPHTILGGALGLALGYLLHVLMNGSLGTTGGYIFGALVLPILYFQLMGWLSLIINATTMTFLLVMTIPHVQAHANFRDLAISLAIGIVYFGLILGIAGRLGAKPADSH